MFNEYYYTDQFGEPIYFSIITLNNSVEISLYVGKKLVNRKSLQRGIHQMRTEDLELSIQIKWFKVITELFVLNKKVEITKLKLKEMRLKLNNLNIHNELNPTEKPIQPFNYNTIIVPSILIIIGFIWEIITKNMGKFWHIPSMIFFIIAYYQFFSPLINKVPERHMDEDTKGKYKIIAGGVGMILTQILLEKILN